MLRTQTSSVPVGHVSGMTAPGGSADPKGQARAPALVVHRLQAPLMVMGLLAAKAAAATIRTAKVAVTAAVVGAQVQVHLQEVVGVLHLTTTLALSVRVHRVLVQVQLLDARCC